MKFKAFEKEDVVQAARLLANRHARERETFPNLKAMFENTKHTETVLSGLLENDYVIGVCAYEDYELLGFILSTIVTNGISGRSARVSYEGLAISGSEDPELYRRLYKEIAKKWVDNGVLSHYVVVPAGDKAVVEAWLKLSFAYEQVYGITSMSKENVDINENLSIRLASKKDAENLKDASEWIMSYQAKSPTYACMVPERAEKIRKGYMALPDDEDSIVLLAYDQDKLVGFQSAYLEEDDLNMMIPENAVAIEISGVKEAFRGRGIGGKLTQMMFNRLIKKGYVNAFADWRIANLSSSNFWTKKGLEPFAYRMHRQIDERVYWATGKALK